MWFFEWSYNQPVTVDIRTVMKEGKREWISRKKKVSRENNNNYVYNKFYKSETGLAKQLIIILLLSKIQSLEDISC